MEPGKTHKPVWAKECRNGNDHEQVELHPCPFKEEIFGNSETLCRCCDECRRECVEDI